MKEQRYVCGYNPSEHVNALKKKKKKNSINFLRLTNFKKTIVWMRLKFEISLNMLYKKIYTGQIHSGHIKGE